ncbi:hypothetical protein ATCC90586_008494 [Pythium insidiosum]|nr:hypothetical protein ATCC90586_008494 [Pythium insidiosum]
MALRTKKNSAFVAFQAHELDFDSDGSDNERAQREQKEKQKQKKKAKSKKKNNDNSLLKELAMCSTSTKKSKAKSKTSNAAQSEQSEEAKMNKLVEQIVSPSSNENAKAKTESNRASTKVSRQISVAEMMDQLVRFQQLNAQLTVQNRTLQEQVQFNAGLVSSLQNEVTMFRQLCLNLQGQLTQMQSGAQGGDRQMAVPPGLIHHDSVTAQMTFVDDVQRSVSIAPLDAVSSLVAQTVDHPAMHFQMPERKTMVRASEMFRFKKKESSGSSSRSSKLIRTTSAEPSSSATLLSMKDSGAKAPANRENRFNSTTTTMMTDDVDDVFYMRGGTEVLVGGAVAAAGSSRGTTTSARSTEQYLRSTGLDTLSEEEQGNGMPASSRRGYLNTQGSTSSASSSMEGGDVESLRAEVAQLKAEMQSIKREMMNEMHLTRYDVLKEVTMLKGTIMQLVDVIQKTGGVAVPACMDAAAQQSAPELSSAEKEALTRRTNTVASRTTKERITSTREDMVPPILRSSSRLTQLAPVADSALSTPLNQEQIDEMFPLIDCSADVAVQARILQAGSREWVFERVQDWLDSRFNVGSDLLLALVGDAGAGKSVCAGAVCDRFDEQVVACHFNKFDKKIKSTPRNVLLSLVNQLTGSLPGFKNQLARLNLKYVLEESDVVALARKVLIDPLNSLEEPMTGKFMVIDGLDQCASPVTGQNDLLDFLSIVLPDLPQWMGVMVTSKPFPELASKLTVTSVLDFSAKSAQYRNDCVGALADVLNCFEESDASTAREILLQKSGGNWAYLDFTRQALTHPGMEDPNGCIPVDVLHDLPQSLYEIYEEIFEDKFGKGRNRLWRKAQPVLELIVAAAAGPYPQLTEAQVMEHLGYAKDDIRMLRRAFIDVVSVRQGTYNLLTSGLFNWLCDPRRQEEQFFVDVKAGVKSLRQFMVRSASGSDSSHRSTKVKTADAKERDLSPTSSSTSSSISSDGGRPPVGRRHEPNMNATAKPVGILKRPKV